MHRIAALVPITLSFVLIISVAACKSEAEKACLDGSTKDTYILSSCGEACDSGNEAACKRQNELGLQRCMTDKDASACQRMCLYSKSSGKELFCKEYENITGKSADGFDQVKPAATAKAPAAAPATPPPTPVNMTAEELNPTCAKIFSAELVAKTHGATEVKDNTPKPGRMAICEFRKGEDVLGTAMLACNPGLDVTLIEQERAAMTKAKDLTPMVGRGGYRLSNSFVFNDDETPCRLMVSWMTLPADDVWPDSLRAMVAAINPATLK